MYRNKKDVDKHVENLLSKLSEKEFKTRAYSVARLYFDVGDFANCQKYVEQYITQKDNNAAAYKLLGQALQKLGQKEKALEQYKRSLDVDPTQTSVVLDICELLADEAVTVDPGQAKYWCEKAEATFPRHPVTFHLREKLVTISNPDPEALVNLLIAELAIRPKDVLLHIRLLKHYMHINKFQEAFEYSCNVEFTSNAFVNNYAWYENLVELSKNSIHNANDWLYQLFLLTVRERICMLSLTETSGNLSKSLIESNELLHDYDQAIEIVAKAGPSPGFAEFHAVLLQHHRGQFAFHAATLLLKKAKKSQMNWREAAKLAAPLMLIAWHTMPLDPKVHWLRHAPEKQINAITRWYSEGSYRCSQSGHYLLTNVQDKTQSILDQISQCCTGAHWKDKLYEKIFPIRTHLIKIKTSHFVSHAYAGPVLRLPRRAEIEAYDCEAQRVFGSSLHHFVWTLLNYKNLAHFKCTLFEMLLPTVTACGPETLNKLDIQAFLYCATITCKQQKTIEPALFDSDKPIILPANITDILCPLPQLKWWDCAYKFTQNGLGTELTDVRATLTRGIEVVRCIDNHGLDAELLCVLGRIFSERSKELSNIDEKNDMEIRAGLYYSAAIPILEKLKSKMIVKIPEKRLFDYTHRDLSSKEINSLIDESKLYIANRYFNDSEYDKVLEILSNLKSPQALFYLSKTYKKLALEENKFPKDVTPQKMTKYATLLSKAKSYGYKALDRLKEIETSKTHPLYIEIHKLIEDIEIYINKIDPDLSPSIFNDGDYKYFSDDNISIDHLPIKTNRRFLQNISSTPKAPSHANVTSYQSAIDTQILESSHVVDQKFFERFENEIKTLHKRDTAINEFMDQTKNWFNENRTLGNQIMSTIHTNIQNTTDQFKLLRISIDHVKDQIDECRNECKDVGEIKKEIADLKKEVNKLKRNVPEETIDENDLYHLDDDYRTNEATSTFSSQLPFAPSQVMPSFNQRLVPPFSVPPNPYQLYGQTLHNLYNHFSQFSQATTAPGATPMFDPARAQVNYPNVYPTPEQIYLDMAHLIPSNTSTASTIPNVPIVPKIPTAQNVPTTVPTMPVISVPPSTSVITPKPITKDKDVTRSLPVNVVITSSDPLPTATVTPAPVLSVTIPSKHIKGTPHNYQIPMPSINETKAVAPPVFNFPFNTNKTSTTTPGSSSLTWNVTSIQTNFKQSEYNTEANTSINDTSLNKSLDKSKSVVDGIYTHSSPNTSVNKSRTFSEKSNTSVENYDPCPDFKPIVPLPAEVIVKTGEEDEMVVFCARAKLFRFVDKQWKERGLGEMKLLKHKITGKVRVLMRREQILKVCANHIISSEMEIKPMINETKAYFWVAHDFADESMVLEKFCIRFKTADIALEFYNTFEKARQEASPSSTDTISSVNTNTIKTETNQMYFNKPVACDKSKEAIDPPLGKAVVGGFTFSSTPTFKPLPNNNETINKPSEQNFNKSNIFGGLALKTNVSSPFGNLFNVPSTITASSTSTLEKQVSSKLNVSDTAEEYEPSVDFKPIIPLPALVDLKTGEEDEVILFEHRAKLLRFVTTTKEWKERGLGNIKLLVHKENINKVRLLMRREQIMKVCCNHAVTKEMVFQKMPNIDKAVTWCAKDFSEGELVAETFCLRFKTVQVCNDFVDAVKFAQSKMKDESKAAKEEQNAAKQNIQTTNVKITKGWGDRFKPKSGSWECQNCLIRNEPNKQICSACNNPKEEASVPVNKTIPENISKFNFGMPSQAVSSVEPSKKEVTLPATSTWGDKFKPKEGSWECNFCLIRNESNLDNCSACNNPKDPNVKKDNKSIFDTNAPTVQFRFGYPPVPSNQEKLVEASTTTSIFDGTGTHKFNFGIPKRMSDNSKPPELVEEQINTQVKSNSENVGPINFSLRSNNEAVKTDAQIKTTLLPTPQTDIAVKQPNDKDSRKFGFVFTPKTSVKDITTYEKSSNGSSKNSDSNVCVNEDDTCISTTSMLNKGLGEISEENETTLYCQPAKLFRFVDGEWKKRGVGTVKILKQDDTENVRVFMRNEQTLKVCLNHTLAPEITYTPRDDQTWLFAANDISEGESSLQQFCLTFSNKEMTLQFKDTIDKVREGMFDREVKVINNDLENNITKEIDDVIFVNEIHATTEEQEKARELMLPENFYTYKTKEPCQGCRGCEHNESKLDSTSIAVKSRSAEEQPQDTFSTPDKSLMSSIKSPTSSIYGTPSNYEKTFDTSIFRMHLDSVNTVTKSAPPTLSKLNNANILSQELDVTDKENNTNKQDSSKLGALNEETQSKPPSIFASGDTAFSTTIKTSVLAPPKLSTVNTIASKETVDTRTTLKNPNVGDINSFFGNTGFGTSTNRSIFDTSATQKSENQNEEVKSMFGGDKRNTANLIGNTTQGTFFGPITTSENDSKSDTAQFAMHSQNSQFETGSSIFRNAMQDCSQNLESGYNLKFDVKKDIVPCLDSNLSFANLSSSVDGSTFEKKPNFQWEGAGQQLFRTAQKLLQSRNESGTGDDSSGAAHGDEEYDPHYEPLVPLPDKIVVTTGEEDEQKLFGERCKLYRYDEKTREWKERGVGEIKILYHPERNTYRLLLRREQILKLVLNMMLFNDLEMLPMMKSDRAWTWAGINYAENPSGEQETLAVRFKSTELANNFLQQVVESVRKLQALSAKAIADDKNAAEKHFESVARLRLPKHLEDSARADTLIASQAESVTQSTSDVTDDPATDSKTETEPTEDENDTTAVAVDVFKQVQFREPEEEEEHDGEEYEYDQNYYDQYYNEEEEDEDESGAFYSCDGEAVIMQGETETKCENAHIIVTFDQEICSPKILVTDSVTGEILTDMLIHTDTEFQMSDDKCTWSGIDFTSNNPVDKTVTVNFYDSETAMRFYDSCETSKAATYSSTDPES